MKYGRARCDPSRRALLGGTAAALAGAVSGCTGLSGDTSPTDDSPPTGEELSVFHYWTGASKRSPAEALRQGFEERHPSIRTDFDGTHAAGANYRRLVRRQIDEEGWSSFADIPGRSLGFYGSSIGDVEAVWDETRLADALPEEVVRACTLGGSRVAVPVAAGRMNVLFYNTEVLDAAGVDPAALTDVEALLDALESVRERTDATPLAQSARSHRTTLRLLEVVLLAQAGPRSYDDLVGGDPRGETVRRAFETLETVVTNYVPDDTETMAVPEAVSRVADGDAAFTQQSSALAYRFREVEATRGEQWDWMPFPGTDGSFDLSFHAFLRPADDPTPRTTSKWLRFVGDRAGQRTFDDPKMGIPVRTDVSTEEMGAFRAAITTAFRSAATRPRSMYGGLALGHERQEAALEAIARHAQWDSFDASSAAAAFVDAVE